MDKINKTVEERMAAAKRIAVATFGQWKVDGDNDLVFQVYDRLVQEAQLALQVNA